MVLRHDALANSMILVAVADGVGGLDHGEVASSMAVGALEKWWNEIEWTGMPKLDELMPDLIRCVKDANGEICRRNAAKSVQSCTTLSVLLMSEEGYRIFHVGDSRIYCIGDGIFGAIQQLTNDHVKLMPKQVDGATIMKAYLTDCVGIQAKFQYQQVSGSYQQGEIYLVCSDGVYKTLSEKDIGKIVRRHKNKVDVACHDLIAKAKENGETDNLTAAVVRIFS